MDAVAPVIDVRNYGIGDVVVACWIAHSARAAGRQVHIRTYGRREVAALLGVPAGCLTTAEPAFAPLVPGVTDAEFRPPPAPPITRFDAWCEGLGLPRLRPVRPPYCELPADAGWAERQWQVVDASGTKTRVLIFPEAAWATRMWPRAYFIDLASELAGLGYAVAAMAGSQEAVNQLPCHWWGGFTVRQAAAMCRRAHLVVANDSGPAHLAAALGTATIAICGPSDPDIVFAHEPNVTAVQIDPGLMPCVGCHFSGYRGYRHACDVGGCQALMRLDPAKVGAAVGRALAGLSPLGCAPCRST
jgi:hypothetical protein